MFDVIGKRRWFYLFSALLTIPGLIFILLSPFTDAGLQLTIDYTGGTRWEIKFADPSVTPEQVEEVFAENGLEATAIRTESGFIEIKTEPIGLVVEPSASPSAVRVALGVPLGVAVRRRPRPARAHRPARVRARRRRPRRRAARRQHRAADRRQARRDGHRARGEPRATIAAQRSLTTIGAVVSSDLLQPGADPHRRRLARHRRLDHVPLPRREVRRDGAGLAAPRRRSSSSGRSRSSARSSTSRSTRCS